MLDRRPVQTADDIPPEWRDTAIGELLAFQNLEREFVASDHARMLVATCMDNRIDLRMPERFAYVVRVAGALLDEVEDSVAVAVGLGGIEAIAVIAHTDCAMVGLAAKRDQLVQGLADRSKLTADDASTLADRAAGAAAGRSAEELAHAEVARLRERYPDVPVAPLLYDVDDDRLYLI